MSDSSRSLNLGNKINLVGQLFERLWVLKDSKERDSSGGVLWVCRCFCGNLTRVKGRSLTSKHTKSCGCGNTIFHQKHGYTSSVGRHPLYRVWSRMKERCYNKNKESYDLYGRRGIAVCKEWIECPKAFIEWAIMNGWRPDLTIERKDVNGNYEPDNCSFITDRMQQVNKRKTLKVECGGMMVPLSLLWERYGKCTSYETLRRRVVILKWDLIRALTVPARSKR